MRPLSREAGLTLVEVLLATGLVTVALLAHVASTFAGHRLSRTQQGRSMAVEFMREFVEHMRSDENWSTLYVRLRAKAALAAQRSAVLGLNAEGGSAGYAPAEYYPDLAVPAGMGATSVLVEVPCDVGSGSGLLRESLDAPEFGLPYDLNGDGKIDSDPRTTDYVCLPVVVVMQWTPPGQPRQTTRIPTWLGGER